MSEWHEFELGSAIRTNETSIGASYPFKEILYLDTGSITRGKIDELQKISISNAPSRAKRLVKDGDVIYSSVRPIQRHYGYISNPPINLVVSTGFVVISCGKDRLDPKFLYYYLTSDSIVEVLDVIAEASTSTYPSLKPSDIEKLNVSFPARLEEQKAIAAVLSSLDNKIDLLHRQNQTLETMAETLFRQWFVDGAQEDWRAGIINNLVEVLSGFPFKSSTFIESGKYQLITIKAVQDGYLELSGADKLTEIPPNMPGYCRLKNGDILLSLTGNVGRCCLVDNDGLLLNQRVAKLQPRHVRDWAFAYVLFRQLSMKRTLEELAKGTAQANLSPIETSNMEFAIPPISILEKYDECATPILKKVLRNKVQIKILERLRDTLLPKLMSGEVRVA